MLGSDPLSCFFRRIPVKPGIISKLKASINCCIIPGIHLHLHSISAHNDPKWVVAAFAPAIIFLVGGGSVPHPIILQASIYVIGPAVISINGIKLAYSRCISLEPMLSVIIGNIASSVISNDHVGISGWINPCYVMISMHIFLFNV